MDRRLIFLLACIPARLLLVWLAFKYTPVYPRYSAALGLAVAASFLYQHFKGETTGFFGGPVTWSRLVHALLFFLFAVASLLLPPWAFAALLADLAYGATTHFSNSAIMRL